MGKRLHSLGTGRIKNNLTSESTLAFSVEQQDHNFSIFNIITKENDSWIKAVDITYPPMAIVSEIIDKNNIGIITVEGSLLDGTIDQWNNIIVSGHADTNGGLIPNTKYYLSYNESGKITTENTTRSVLIALSNTQATLHFENVHTITPQETQDGILEDKIITVNSTTLYNYNLFTLLHYNGSWVKADPDNNLDVSGILYQKESPDTVKILIYDGTEIKANTSTWENIISGGLTPNQIYYATANGQYTTTETSQKVLYAIDNERAIFKAERNIANKIKNINGNNNYYYGTNENNVGGIYYLNYLTKNQYDTNNSGIVDKVEKLESIDTAPPKSIYGKNGNGEIGFHEIKQVDKMEIANNKLQLLDKNDNLLTSVFMGKFGHFPDNISTHDDGVFIHYYVLFDNNTVQSWGSTKISYSTTDTNYYSNGIFRFPVNLPFSFADTNYVVMCDTKNFDVNYDNFLSPFVSEVIDSQNFNWCVKTSSSISIYPSYFAIGRR